MPIRANRRRLVAILLAVFGAALAHAEVPCLEDDTGVTVTVHQTGVSPPAYVFTVQNNTELPIVSVDIGWGQSPDPVVTANISNVPTSMGSPKGWIAAFQAAEGGRTMYPRHKARFRYYSWDLDYGDDRAQILPGESLSGFSIQLPTISESAHLDYQGRRVVQHDLTKVPFRVRSPYRTCHTGSVAVDR